MRLRNKILVLFAHPVMHKSRVNLRLIEAIKNVEDIRIHDLGAVYSYLRKQKNPAHIDFEGNWDILASRKDKVRITNGFSDNGIMRLSSFFPHTTTYGMEFKGDIQGLQDVRIEALQALFTDRGIPSKYSERVYEVDSEKKKATKKYMRDNWGYEVENKRQVLEFNGDGGNYALELKTSNISYVQSSKDKIVYRVHLEDRTYRELRDKQGYIRQSKYFKGLLGALAGGLYQLSGTKPSFDSLSFSPLSIEERRVDEELTSSAITRRMDIRKPIYKPIEDLWIGYEAAECSHCASVYPSEQVSVYRGKLQADDPTCKHCGVSTPEIIDDF